MKYKYEVILDIPSESELVNQPSSVLNPNPSSSEVIKDLCDNAIVAMLETHNIDQWGHVLDTDINGKIEKVKV